LDELPNRPFLGVNVFAPLRAIKDGITAIVNEWKQSLNIPQQRRRPDKLHKYLQVWDLREGWADGEYDPSRELPFRGISLRLGESVATVADRHRSAFELLSGHAYNTLRWARLFIVPKLAGAYRQMCLSRRQTVPPERSRSVKTVPEARLTGSGDAYDSGLVAAFASQSEAADASEIVNDILSLIEQRFNDEAILRRIEPDNRTAMREAIRVLRERLKEPTT
jgi:hypothetical protein